MAEETPSRSDDSKTFEGRINVKGGKIMLWDNAMISSNKTLTFSIEHKLWQG